MEKIRPMGFLESLIFFGISAILFWSAVRLFLPYLIDFGIMPFWSFLISYATFLSLLIMATFYFLKRENSGMRVSERLRFAKFTPKQFLVWLGIFVVGFLLTGLLLPTAIYIASMELFSPPGFLPSVLDPLKNVPGGILGDFMGVPLKGAYWIIPVYFVFLTFFNILGEELWFRGYILPRQELSWGKRTWVYHGIFWCLFHVIAYPWTIVYLLPTTLTVSFAAQRFRNTWAGFTVHYLGNGILALLPIIWGVFD